MLITESLNVKEEVADEIENFSIMKIWYDQLVLPWDKRVKTLEGEGVKFGEEIKTPKPPAISSMMI